MNVILYARVSTDKQAEKDLSIPAQLQAMRDHARREGWTILEEFIEPGASARTTDRPILKELLQRCKKLPKVDVVLVHKIDRLARSVIDHATIKTVLRQAGARLSSVVENVDDSITGQLVENIMASLAEFYSANLGEEAKKGMRMVVQRGGWPHRPPVGYRIDRTDDGSRRIVLDEAKAPAVRSAFERYGTGAWSLNRLRLHLAEEGLLTASGKPLAQERVRAILRNPFYAGRIRWAGSEGPGRHPALVDDVLFARVQRVVKLRHRDSGEKGRYQFPLRGIAVCAQCGSKMTAEHHSRGSYYRCTANAQAPHACRGSFCNVKNAHRDAENLIGRLVLTSNFRTRVLKAVDALLATKRAGRREQRRRIALRRRQLENKEATLTEAFVAGDVSLVAYRRAMVPLRAEIGHLVDLEREASADPDVIASRIRRTLEVAGGIRDLYDRADVNRKTDLLRLVFSRVTMGKSGVADFVLRPPFDSLFTHPANRSGAGPSDPDARLFEDCQLEPAINSMIEHEIPGDILLPEDDRQVA